MLYFKTKFFSYTLSPFYLARATEQAIDAAVALSFAFQAVNLHSR
jgi:hypothetical protein